jgi:hypothetical protein
MIYDLYGLKSENLEEARVAVERALGVAFAAHTSSYVGDYYRKGDVGEENFILRDNFNPCEEEWTEKEFQEYGILLYVSETMRADEIRKLLTDSIPSISLLRRDSF